MDRGWFEIIIDTPPSNSAEIVAGLSSSGGPMGTLLASKTSKDRTLLTVLSTCGHTMVIVTDEVSGTSGVF